MYQFNLKDEKYLHGAIDIDAINCELRQLNSKNRRI
jgi:hypothetical protein